METADGRKLTVSRSVTIGKSFGAVLIVVAGYLIARFILGWIERRIVAAHRSTPQAAALLRKWILLVLTAILAIFALLSTSIPLTAFAFLGGALAIAAGFGLQTLLKNLVSGVMLLVERPLRLGDLVEVDGLRGRVTEIGLRASTIRSADGTESMVPNSRFLDGNMTNWTYSSPSTRQSIALGVADGSSLRRVNEILNDVVTRHGLVLQDPAPQVRGGQAAEPGAGQHASHGGLGHPHCPRNTGHRLAPTAQLHDALRRTASQGPRTAVRPELRSHRPAASSAR